MNPESKRKVTVEDLLRLKRAERPPAAFWATFEAEIRAKQLSAIVNKRPWWHGLSRAAAVVSRYQLPFGAAAALAVTWAGVHYYSASPSGVIRVQGAAPEAPVAAAAPSRAAAPAPVVLAEPAARRETAASVAQDEPVRTAVVTATSSHITKAPSEVTVDAISKSPFADGISVSLADYRTPSAEVARRSVFGTDRDFEASLAPARQAPSDPLARMDPAEERRARLLAPALPAYSATARRSLASDWIRSKSSSDDRMYESMDRGSSDRMLVGFRF